MRPLLLLSHLFTTMHVSSAMELQLFWNSWTHDHHLCPPPPSSVWLRALLLDVPGSLLRCPRMIGFRSLHAPRLDSVNLPSFLHSKIPSSNLSTPDTANLLKLEKPSRLIKRGLGRGALAQR